MIEQENTTTGENKEQEQDCKCGSGHDGCCQSDKPTQESVKEEADDTAETPTPLGEEENKI